MKKTAILALFILTTVAGFAQSDVDGGKILLDNGVSTHAYNVAVVTEGIIITTRDNSNVPVNYVYTSANQLKRLDYLNGYIVLDNSNDILLLGKYKAGHSDSMCREIYTFNLLTKKLVLQANSGWIYGSPKFIGDDSITFTANIKRASGVGSDLVTKSVKLK